MRFILHHVSVKGLLLFAGLIQLNAQEMQFEHVPLPAGNGEVVVDIEEDSQGFMWFATWGGLHKYDGYEITTYSSTGILDTLSQSGKSETLQSDRVETLHVDNDGYLWIGLFDGGGLARFNPMTETFTHYQSDSDDPGSLSENVITAILEDSRGVLWIGTNNGGLNRFEPETETFRHFRFDLDDPTSLGCDNIRVIYEDRNETLWIGTGQPYGECGGLNRFEPDTESFIRYNHDPDDESSLISNEVAAILEDSRGTFWVGTFGDGLHRMDRDNGTFERLVYDPRTPNRPHRPRLQKSEPFGEYGFPGVRDILETSDGAIWIAGYKGGLDRWDPTTGRLRHFEYDPDHPQSLAGNLVWTLHESRDGTLWLGTWQGLQKITPRQKSLARFEVDPTDIYRNHVHAFEHADLGEADFWVGTRNGLCLYDTRREITVRCYEHDPNDARSLSNSWIWALFMDSEGTLWIGTDDGVNRYEPDTGRFTRLRPDMTEELILDKLVVTSFHESSDGTLWFGKRSSARGGLFTIDRNRNTFSRRWDASEQDRFFGVCAIQESDAAELWLGLCDEGNGGKIVRFNPDSGEADQIVPDPEVEAHLNESWITSLHTGDNEVLWAASLTRGLLQIDMASNRVQRFTKETNRSLPENFIKCFVEDAFGDVWFSTQTAIVQLRPNSTFQSYTDDDLGVGILSNGACFRSGVERLLFGGSDGFVALNPEDRQSDANPYAPEVIVTEFRVRGESSVQGTESKLDRPIWDTDAITLSHDENDFSIDFVGLHYRDTARNRHEFMLQNHDQQWRRAGSDRTATYTGLSPGLYTFRVRASNSDGIWSGPTTLLIRIRPPWWRTVWAYSIYFLLLITGVWGAFHVHKALIIKQEREKTRERELAQAHEIEKAYAELKATQLQLVQSERMASLGQLTSGIAHEINNPLNFVSSNIEPLRRDIADLRSLLDSYEGEMEKLKQTEQFVATRQLKEELDIPFVDQEIDHLLSGIHQGAERTAEIVRSMQSFSRIRGDDMIPANVHEGIDAALIILGNELGDLVEVVKKYGEISDVLCFPGELNQVFLHILTNAIQAIEGNGEISITTWMENATVKIAIRDTGVGIPESARAKIFEPFFTTKDVGHGSGLGLSVSYGIIKELGGTIDVTSEPGKGTEFVVTLPQNRQ